MRGAHADAGQVVANAIVARRWRRHGTGRLSTESRGYESGSGSIGVFKLQDGNRDLDLNLDPTYMEAMGAGDRDGPPMETSPVRAWDPETCARWG